MRRHVLYGRYGPDDTAVVPVLDDETATQIGLLSQHNRLGHGIGRALDDLRRTGLTPSAIGIDLLALALHVQAADTRISRKTESQDGWTREIRIVVPVDNPELWGQAGRTLKRDLDFLTGDLWTIDFRAKPEHWVKALPPVAMPLTDPPFDGVSLFSGGLDSLIGAIDVLERGGEPLLVSHADEGATSAAQAACFKGLQEQYIDSQFRWLRLWMDLQGIEISGSDHEMTKRGRSFLFFATGIFAGTCLNRAFTLAVPENGFIALNVPLDPLRLGSHSTRTTHPFYIARWNEMLNIVGIPSRIENPYWDKTKGEMVSSCANRSLLTDLVPKSLSCSSPTKGRWQHLPIQHCGYCLPCLIRRAAIVTGLGEGGDKTRYTIDDLTKRVLDSTQAEGQQIRSFQFSVNRLRVRPKLASFLVHSTGSLSDEPLDRQDALVDVYRRGLAEVEQILEGVHTEAKK